MHVISSHAYTHCHFTIFFSFFVDFCFSPFWEILVHVLIPMINSNVCALWRHTFCSVFLPHFFLSCFFFSFLSSSFGCFPSLRTMLHVFLLVPPPPSSPLSNPSPTVGKWHVARVPAWTDTPLAAEAPPAPNSLALVATWTSSRRLRPHRQRHPSCSPPSTSIRKMDRPTFSLVSCRTGAQAGTGRLETIRKPWSLVMIQGRWNKWINKRMKKWAG